MVHSSHTRSNISMDLFNLPSLPDQRRSMTMLCDFPKNFYIPGGKNSRMTQIINKWLFDRQTPASQTVMDDWIIVSCPVKFPARNSAMGLAKYPNMFSGRVGACPCPEFRNKFPNLYLEPMQCDNADGKWQDVIPYMIINFDYDRDILHQQRHCHSICT